MAMTSFLWNYQKYRITITSAGGKNVHELVIDKFPAFVNECAIKHLDKVERLFDHQGFCIQIYLDYQYFGERRVYIHDFFFKPVQNKWVKLNQRCHSILHLR